VADVDDRWYATDKATGERVPTARHGVGRRWVARWRDENGKQCSKSYERKADAERFVAGVATALAKGDYIDERRRVPGPRERRHHVDDLRPPDAGQRRSSPGSGRRGVRV
jgi:hypothetical protein